MNNFPGQPPEHLRPTTNPPTPPASPRAPETVPRPTVEHPTTPQPAHGVELIPPADTRPPSSSPTSRTLPRIREASASAAPASEGNEVTPTPVAHSDTPGEHHLPAEQPASEAAGAPVPAAEQQGPQEQPSIPIGAAAVAETTEIINPMETPDVMPMPTNELRGDDAESRGLSEEGVALAQRYGHLATTDKLMEVATKYDQNDSLTPTEAYGAVVLSHIRDERVAASPRVAFRLTYEEEALPEVNNLHTQLWAVAERIATTDPRMQALDMHAATKRMAFSLVRHAKDTGTDILADPAIIETVWRNYLGDAVALADFGIKKPEALAIYNGKELLDRLAVSSEPKLEAYLANARPKAPLEAIDQFNSAIEPLQRQYASHSYVTPGVVREMVKTNPGGAATAIEERIRNMQAAHDTYDGMEGAEIFFSWAHSNTMANPVAEAERFTERNEYFRETHAGDPDFTPEVTARLSVQANTESALVLQQIAEDYKATLVELREKVMAFPERSGGISDEALREAAATNRVKTMRSRMRLAHDIQNRMDREQ